jgi:hypothetical protein
MNIFEIVEVGIGVIFVWLLLSLASMTLQEWLAGWLMLRSKDLETQIRHLLCDPEEAWINKERWLNKVIRGLVNLVRKLFRKGEIPVQPIYRIKLGEAFYEHPLIKGLAKKGKKPSYIPDRLFSTALLDVLMDTSTDGSYVLKELKQWEKMVDEKKLPPRIMAAIEIQFLEVQGLIKDYSGKPEFRSKISAKLEAMVNQLSGMNTKLDPALEALSKMAYEVVQIDGRQLISGINHLWHSHPEISRVFSSFLAEVYPLLESKDSVLEEIYTQLETWFNDSMERLSGWYKRRAQLIGVIIGLLLAVLFNVDTISISEALWREPIVREALVKRAESFEMPETGDGDGPGGTDPEEAWNEFYKQFDGLSLPLGWDYDEGACIMEGGEKIGLKNLAFVINQQCYLPADSPGEALESWNWFWIKIFGWIISGAASGQGATYWFDILKRLVNVRSTGNNPDDARTKKGR